MKRAKANIYKDDHTGGWIAEVQGLYDPRYGRREWIRLGTYGTRKAAVKAATEALSND